ncbi:DUF4397 domain-containing protein [Marinobacter alexandrii]|uniref:DUF4397 domain-containing protein n=2 Tax=Marinobacter TaxID=2742 RepID=UPI003264DCEB
MNTKFTISLATVGSILLSGCFDSDSDSKNTSVRVVHASSDAPAVNVRFSGGALNTNPVVSGADYKQAAELTPRAGSSSIAIDGILPGGDTTTVIETDASFRFDTHYDVIAVGKVGDSSIAALVLADNGNRDSATSVRLRVAHLSPDAEAAAAGPVDVFVTAAGDPLPADATFTFSFQESVGPLEVPAGDYQIRVTPTGSDTVVYDSGTVPLPAGADLLIGAVDNTVFGDSPVSLLVVNGADTSEILDVGTGAGIRAAHNSAAPTPNVDIYVNEDPDLSPAAGDVAFGETVPAGAVTGSYVELATGSNRVAVTAAGDTSTAVIDETLDLANGDLRTLVAAGILADGLDLFAFTDDNRQVVTEARLRVLHGAVEAQSVDVFLIPTAAGGAGSTLIGNASPALDDFQYGTSSGYVSVAADDYVIFITSDDGSTELYKSPSLTLSAGGVYTALARLEESMASVATVTLLDDFVIP